MTYSADMNACIVLSICAVRGTIVVHHIDCTIPHYHAEKATEAVKAAFPDVYLYDPTPVPEALWKVAVNCSVVQPKQIGAKNLYVFVE